jgi:hypothetical protein
LPGPSYAWQDLPGNSARASDRIVAEDFMTTNKDAQNKKDKAAKRKASAASKETRRERKAEKLAKREAAQKEKAESGKPIHLCSLATVEVRKGNDGFHVSVSGSQGSRRFTIAPDQTTQILRDLETAILVIRSQG